MNQLNLFLFFIFITAHAFGQKMQEVELNYLTEIPFKTSQDSEYYHLESTMMIRGITNDIYEFSKQHKNQKSDVLFKLYFKSKTGANLLIEYAVNTQSMASYFSTDEKVNSFKKDTYDWINRSFRSNIPFED
ncbi:MAG: hypothetical protein CMC01_06565 [Flavobacteriaceae bacterium]|nr:hypothetical protein [Flavobacteriaceae bacterium]|tara:strand:- start:2537 stop:2932 length:396 start_codon:yes stop_codon:yes gene_type:complete